MQEAAIYGGEMERDREQLGRASSLGWPALESDIRLEPGLREILDKKPKIEQANEIHSVFK